MITCGLFSDFQYGFRSSQSTADLVTVVSDRIARSLNRSGATRAVALDTSKAFDMQVVLTNLSLMEFQVRYLTLFLLFSVIDGCTWFWMGSLYKGILLILDFLQAPFLAGVKVMLSHRIWLSVFATWLFINFLNFKLCLVILGTKNRKLFSSFLVCKVGCNFSTK